MSSHPQRFKIRHRPAAAQVPQVTLPSKHRGYFTDRFFFHCRGRAPAIERVIIGINVHRQRIRQPRHGMRRLQHLARIQRMEVRVVVLQAFRGPRKHFADALAARHVLGKLWQLRESFLQLRRSLGQQVRVIAIKHKYLGSCALQFSSLRPLCLRVLCVKSFVWPLLPNLVQLPGRLQQIQFRLLSRKVRIQVIHPTVILRHARSFHFSQIHAAFAKLRLQHFHILLRQL